MDVSTKILLAEARELGIKTEILDADANFSKLSRGRKFIYCKATKQPLNSCVAERLAGDKYLTRLCLTRAKLPMAKGFCLKPGELPELKKKIQKLKYPLVVKPARADCGICVTTGIDNFAELKKAVAPALQHEITKHDKFASGVIIEEMLKGDEFRIVVVGQKVVAVVQRVPAHVIGDGHSTIKELVEQTNNWLLHRYDHYKDVPLKPSAIVLRDQIATDYLKKQKLTWQSVLPKGKLVYLRKNSNTSTGGRAIDRTADICSANKKMAVQAAQAVGAQVAGVDFMTTDLNRPWFKTKGCGIVELNCTIGLSLHHFPHHGRPRNVSRAIMQELIKQKYL